MNSIEIHSHCDNPDCDLGSVHFICPACNKLNINYDLWWEELKDGLKCNCKHCKVNLEIHNTNYEYKIKTMEGRQDAV